MPFSWRTYAVEFRREPQEVPIRWMWRAFLLEGDARGHVIGVRAMLWCIVQFTGNSGDPIIRKGSVNLFVREVAIDLETVHDQLILGHSPGEEVPIFAELVTLWDFGSELQIGIDQELGVSGYIFPPRERRVDAIVGLQREETQLATSNLLKTAYRHLIKEEEARQL